MKAIHILLSALLCIAISSSCGTTQAAGSATSQSTYSIEAQCDPLVIEIDSFEGRNFSGERSFIAIYDNQVWGKIPTVAGMAHTGMMTSSFALTFDRSSARISDSRISKKGDNYFFTAYVQDGRFFGRSIRTDWRIGITVRFDGHVDINIDSDSIGKVYRSRTWNFTGHVNKERTEAAKLYKGNEPEFL